jgi:hypothetical protein
LIRVMRPRVALRVAEGFVARKKPHGSRSKIDEGS